MSFRRRGEKPFGRSLARLNPFRSKNIDRDKILNISRVLILFRSGLSPEDEFDRKSFFSVLNVFGLNPDIRDAREIIRTAALTATTSSLVPQAAAKDMQQPEINASGIMFPGAGISVP